jgi:tRNA dimethylallyltransferase
MRSVGYRQVWDYLAGNCDHATMVERGIAATRQLAKRQLTWLRGWEHLQELPCQLDGQDVKFVKNHLKTLNAAAIYW